MDKVLFSTAAIALTFIAFLPYIRSIHQGITKPHVFSWVIWGSTTFVVFLAQLTDRGGIGAWPIGISGIITLYVAFLAYIQKSDTLITSTDWLFLILSMSSLPLWYLTSDPFWAVLILTTVDVLGFGPTFRKAYSFPFEEQLRFFVIMAVRNLISILALEHYSQTTVLFPAVIASTSLLFIVMVMYRRQVLVVK
ncbi:MAG: hypothetical protein L3J75_02735 [Methylococcaceae bacterium]|nr:hypothetical protein [Methylococcaceae bacterium]